MTCSVCHDPHTAGMKTVAGATTSSMDASALCENCHKDAMKNFPTSKHAEPGVTCVNCHLGFNVGNNKVSATDFVTAHKAPDHSFMPTLDYLQYLPRRSDARPGSGCCCSRHQDRRIWRHAYPRSHSVATAISTTSKQAAPVSPLGFSGLAGLLGLAGGMVLSSVAWKGCITA